MTSPNSRLGARGSRAAKSKNRDARYRDRMYDLGVLTRPGERAWQQIEAQIGTVASGEVITIDSEFQALIPPQTPEENAALEESLLRDGCNDALVLWQGHNILIDGHHRYALCMKHGLPYTTRELGFESREDVIVWMVQHQLARRNINDFVRGELAGRLKAAIEAKAKANLVTSTGGTNPQPLMNSTKAEKSPVHTRKQLAQLADTSEDTIRKIEKVVSEAPAPIVAKARNGELSTNRAYNLTKALKGASEQITAFVTESGMDDPERVEILKRLEKSAGSPETNGTFDEIMRTGGFRYGDGMTLECDFVNDSIQTIQRGLDDIAKQHRRMANDAKRKTALDAAMALAETGVYHVLYADPPWQYDNSGLNGSAAQHYPTMPTTDICSLLTHVPAQIADNAALFLWATSPLLLDALTVMAAWGFTYKTQMVWVKDRGTYGKLGFYVSGRHELLLIGTRGSYLPEFMPDSVIEAPKHRHSSKPDAVRETIESMYPGVRYLELFAREAEPRNRWTFWGAEAEVNHA